jgi:hypothetical protein
MLRGSPSAGSTLVDLVLNHAIGSVLPFEEKTEFSVTCVGRAKYADTFEWIDPILVLETWDPWISRVCFG